LPLVYIYIYIYLFIFKKTDLPNGIPFLYEFDEQLELVEKRKYLADPTLVEAAIARVNNIIR
jgi:hypothetical protein